MRISCVLSQEKRESLHKYTITIKDLTFETIIGILDKERVMKQRVIADVKITYHKEAETFINYAQVAKLIEKKMQKEKYFLLEEALDAIILEIKREFSNILSINLKICKPDILDNCEVAVEIFKKY